MLVHLGNDGWPVGCWPVGSNNGSRSVSWSGNNGSRGVSRSRDNWCGCISWSRCWSIDWFTGVLNIGDVASVGIRGVGDSLEATIRKSNVVFSLGGIAIAGL